MSSKGGYAALPPSPGVGRFYNPPAVRRQQQILLQQQKMMQLEQQEHQQLQFQLAEVEAEAVKPESSAGEEVVERSEVDFLANNAAAAALSVPPSVGSESVSNVTNLDRLIESVTPYIRAQNLSELNTRGLKTHEKDSHSFFCMGDLWESFNEWSVCGAGVPLLMNGKDPTVQYYVPFLSGLQLYIDSSSLSSRLSSDSEAERRARSILNSNMQQLNRLSLVDDNFSFGSSGFSEPDIANSPGLTLFSFLEQEQPHYRRPLSDKISALASQYPHLSMCRSCDLLPTSWICVAWYPIYRIPIGPTLRDLDACFLTFHSLSTQPTSKFPARLHAANTRIVRKIVDPTAKISLPVFGLASYKLKGSIVSPCGPQECEQENTLLQSADNWLQNLQVILPDYQFFRAHHSHRR